jgi:hypothetical protein
VDHAGHSLLLDQLKSITLLNMENKLSSLNNSLLIVRSPKEIMDAMAVSSPGVTNMSSSGVLRRALTIHTSLKMVTALMMPLR